MTDFAVLRTPSQVLFGAGMAAAAGRVAAGHGRRVLVITDPVIAETPGFGTVLESLADLDVAVFRDAVVDVPRSAVDAAVAAGRSFAPDVIVAVGGGSVIDLAKVTALLLAHGGALEDYYAVQSVPGPIVPLIALPTTAGTGSEATPVSVITDPATEMKIGVASPHLIPRHALCDPLLTRRRAAGGHRARGDRRALARDRGLHGRARGAVARARARPPAGRQEPALGHAGADRGGPHRAQPRARGRRTARTSRRGPGCSTARCWRGWRSPTPASRPRTRCSSPSAR